MKYALALCISLLLVSTLSAQQNVIAGTDELGRFVSKEYEWDSIPAHCIMAYIDNISYNIDTVSHYAQVIGKYQTPSCPKCGLLKVNYRGVIIIPDSIAYGGETYPVTSIAREAFRRCIYLYHVSMPNTVSEVGAFAFTDCIRLREPVRNDRIFSYLPESYEGDYTVPDGIKTISGGAFANCKKVTTITIPNSITQVAPETFAGCKQLYEPVYNDHLFAYMPGSPFFGTSYTIPDGIQTIGNGAFMHNDQLTTVIMPNTVTTIGESAFLNCPALDTIELSPQLKTIGQWAFAYCEGMHQMHIPEGVQEIGEYAFSDCANLQTLSVPGSVKTISTHAFDRCFQLKSLTLAEGISTIESYAFGCSWHLKNVKIPASVRFIGHHAFYLDEGHHFTIDSANPSYYIDGDLLCSSDHRVLICLNTKAKAITIPETITDIEKEAFLYCYRLKLKIPKRFEGVVDTSYCKKVKYY